MSKGAFWIQRLQLISRLAGRSEFAANVTILAAGTLAGQVITISVAPVLTRIYTPEQMGVFNIFMMINLVLVGGVAQGYGPAIILPKSDRSARDLFALSVCVTVFFSILTLLAIGILHEQIVTWFEAPELSGWIYLLVPLLLIFGVFRSMMYVGNREKDYVGVGASKIIRAISMALITIAVGLLASGWGGLAIGFIAGFFVSGLFLLHRYRKNLSWDIFRLSRRRSWLLRHYADFPLFNGTSGCLLGLTTGAPVFIMAVYFSENAIGQYYLLFSVANAPTAFIAESIGQVNLQKVAQLVRDGVSVRPFVFKLAGVIASISIVPALLLMLLSPTLFPPVFGESFRPAGEILQILMPAIYVRFVIGTLSNVLQATKHTFLMMIWRIIGLIGTWSVLLLAAQTGDLTTFFQAFLVLDICLYIVLFAFIWWAAGHPRNTSKKLA